MNAVSGCLAAWWSYNFCLIGADYGVTTVKLIFTQQKIGYGALKNIDIFGLGSLWDRLINP